MEHEIYKREDIEKESWVPRFINHEQYVEAKLRILRCDMYIEPTKEEIEHLHELKTKTAIDNAVHSIINRHWKDTWERV